MCVPMCTHMCVPMRTHMCVPVRTHMSCVCLRWWSSKFDTRIGQIWRTDTSLLKQKRCKWVMWWSSPVMIITSGTHMSMCDQFVSQMSNLCHKYQFVSQMSICKCQFVSQMSICVNNINLCHSCQFVSQFQCVSQISICVTIFWWSLP